MTKQNLYAYIKIVLAVISWAGVYHSANYLAHHADIYTIAFVRYFIASLMLVIIMRIKNGSFMNKQLFMAHWQTLITIGVIGIGFYNIAFFVSEKYMSANMVALIFAINPCLTILLASLYFRQKLSYMAYIGLFIALCGAIGVINFANPECGRFWCNPYNHIGIGEVSAIILCFLAAIFNITNRVATQKGIDSLTITTYAAIFGDIVLFIFMVCFGEPNTILHQDSTFWWAMAYTIVIASVGAYFLYSEGIKQLGVAKSVVFINGIPFTTILIGIILFGDHIKLSVITSGIVIIIGVMIANSLGNKPRRT